jgi:antitoxin component of MazEF toxin-antitoxin module
MDTKLDATEHAVNVRKRGGSLIVRIPPDITNQLNIKDGQLALVLVNKEEKVIAYRFLQKRQ